MSTVDKMIAKGERTQSASTSSLENSLRIISDTTTIGAETGAKITQQKDTLLRIDGVLTDVDVIIDKSNIIIRTMRNREVLDKCIWVGIIIFVILIIVIIVKS